MRQTLTSVELFTGAGGLALGTATAGFRHRLLVEHNCDACKTLRLNLPLFGGAGCVVHEGDVRKVDFAPYAGVDLLAAGAPCQPFSIGGKHRADQDERNLFPEVFRAVRALRPRAVLVENVRGLLRPALSDFVEYVQLQLEHPSIDESAEPGGWQRQLAQLRRVARAGVDRDPLQFRVHRVLLNAADFGVPQKRQRVFFVGIRRDQESAWVPPAPTHSEKALGIAQDAAGEYWRGHGIQWSASNSARTTLAGRSKVNVVGARWLTVRDALADLPEAIVGKADARFSNHVAQPGARVYPGHTGSALDEPAKTLKAGVHGVPGGENMLRRLDGSVRYFTVREAARIQTFPDNFVLAGAWGEAMRQIGNAVPPKLAEAVARSIAECLAKRTQSDSPRRGRSLAHA